jgi:hypothetical protein
MSDSKEPYGVDPGEPARPSQPAPESTPRLFDVPIAPPKEPVAPRGKIEAPELLSGFEEDADFDKDPELDRVIMGKPVGSAKPIETEQKPGEDFVRPGLGTAKVWSIVGVVLLVAAMIATGVQVEPGTTPLQRLLRVLLILYSTLLHTGTGVVAVFVGATLLGKRVGNFELAAARMFAAVGAFALMISMRVTVFGYPMVDRTLALILASAAYVLLVASTFNLWKKHPLGYVVGSHFFLWLIVAIGMLLTGAVKIAPTTSPAARTPAPSASPSSPSTSPATKPATTP